jgi:hypothetical protein
MVSSLDGHLELDGAFLEFHIDDRRPVLEDNLGAQYNSGVGLGGRRISDAEAHGCRFDVYLFSNW